MYRLLSDITANPHMPQTRLKGGTEGEAPPIGKGGKSSSPHHVMGEHAGGWREDGQYDYLTY